MNINMSNWKIKGESGKRLGDEVVTPANLRIDNISISLSSLNVDTAKFSQVYDGFNDVDSPELGQIIEIYRDGARVFRGHVTNTPVKAGASGGVKVSTTVSGLWWWLEQTPLSGAAEDQNGGVAERIAFGLKTGDLREHIITLLQRSIQLGVPLIIGNIDDCFDIPQITLKQMSCADALAELMRWVPDGVIWIDYSTNIPTVNMTRRSGAEVEVFKVGEKPLKSISVNPKYGLEVSQVVVSYVSRGVDGRTVYEEQVGGIDDGGGTRQIFTVSGPELDSFLPNDFFDSYQAQTEELILKNVFSKDSSLEQLSVNHPTFKDAVKGLPYVVPSGLGITTNKPSLTFKKENGDSLSPGVDYYLTTDEPPEWYKTQNMVERVFISGTIVVGYLQSAEPSFEDDMTDVFEGPFFVNDFNSGGTSKSSQYYFYAFEQEVWGVKSNYTTLTTAYRDADYSFIVPPEGLAQALKITQSFTPYEGVIGISEVNTTADSYLGKVVNIVGALPEHANMRAMVQGVAMDIKSGQASIILGTPGRHSFHSLVNRFRRTSSDNIIYI